MAAHVYSRFEVTKVDGTKVKLRIQDIIRAHDQEYVMTFMHKYFIHEETNYRNSGVPKSEAAKWEIMFVTYAIMEDKRACPLVCCIDDEDQDKVDVVGCDVLMIKRNVKQELPLVQTEEGKILLKIAEECDNVYNLLDHFDVDEYLIGAGLSVDPSYRGCGIATELLKARKPLMQRRGFKITGVWLSSIGSQKAGVKAGYEQVAEISHEELGRRVGITFTDCPPTTKYMILKA